jgi:tellurite methyltransferase
VVGGCCCSRIFSEGFICTPDPATRFNTVSDVGRRLAEIWRVLKPKALYQGTMLPTRNINYGRGRTVAPDTFVRDRAEERGHPHFYCDAATLVALYAGFELLSLKQQLQRKPGSWHWHVMVERRPQ